MPYANQQQDAVFYSDHEIEDSEENSLLLPFIGFRGIVGPDKSWIVGELPALQIAVQRGVLYPENLSPLCLVAQAGLPAPDYRL